MGQSKAPKAWNFLEENDRIGLVATAFKPPKGQLRPTKSFLKKWQLDPVFERETFGSHFLMANSDAIRLRILKKFLTQKSFKGVWSLRGGYGSIRLLPDLKNVKPPKDAKVFVGLSDMTSLLIFLNQNWGWNVLHGPNLVKLGSGVLPASDQNYLRRVLFGEIKTLEFSNLKPLNKAARRKKLIKAPIIGGNLITLQSTLATDFEIQTRGKFLLIEDIGERGYKIDRVLEHLRQAGKFVGLKGILLGQFTGGKEPNGRSLVPRVLSEFAQSVDIPVVAGFQAGHDRRQKPVPFGPKATLELGSKCGLSVPSGGQ